MLDSILGFDPFGSISLDVHQNHAAFQNALSNAQAQSQQTSVYLHRQWAVPIRVWLEPEITAERGSPWQDVA